MSLITYNTLITEVDEIRENMDIYSEPMTRDRLEVSLALNKINSEVKPSDLLEDYECVYEDSEIEVYEAEDITQEIVESKISPISPKNTDEIGTVMSVIQAEACSEYTDTNRMVHWIWTKDILYMDDEAEYLTGDEVEAAIKDDE